MRALAKLGKAALCALLALVLLGAAAGAETLRVGVRDDIINFGFYNETTGKYYGLEIDLAAELAQRIGCDGVEYITVTPDTRKDMLLNGEVDVVIATYSIAESREENFDFSAPYYFRGTQAHLRVADRPHCHPRGLVLHAVHLRTLPSVDEQRPAPAGDLPAH